MKAIVVHYRNRQINLNLKIMKSKYFYLLFGLSLILLIISICLNISHVVITNESIVLFFIGVIATIIVISNYAQVAEIKRESEKKLNELNEKIIEINSRFNEAYLILNNRSNDIGNELSLLKNKIAEHKDFIDLIDKINWNLLQDKMTSKGMASEGNLLNSLSHLLHNYTEKLEQNFITGYDFLYIGKKFNISERDLLFFKSYIKDLIGLCKQNNVSNRLYLIIRNSFYYNNTSIYDIVEREIATEMQQNK